MYHTSVVYDGKMWVIGGFDGTRKNDVWCWSPYHRSGTYISSNHDTGVSDARITQVSWTATGLALSMEVAAGNTPNPTNWEQVTNGDTSIAVAGRYIRYRATFSGTGLSDDPELKEITIDYAIPTSITCSVDDPTPAPGQEIGISGYLRDPDGAGVGGKTIHLYKNGFDTGLTTLTRADGYYGILTTASSTPRTDNYSVRFAGDGDYLESWSHTVQVTVEALNQPPILSGGSVSPSTGPAETDFVFEVTYADNDGDAPAYVKVFIDGNGYDMTKISGTYADGALHRYTWGTDSTHVGSHSYYFTASDGVATTRLPTTDSYPGPTVNPAHKIYGYVKSEGTPIVGAQVTLDGKSTTTDENGYYEFTGLEENMSYTVEVSAVGYESYSKAVYVGTADNQLDVSLVKVEVTPAPTYKVFGWVKSEGVPVADAQVTLDGQSTTTDVNGYYEFRGLEGNRSYTVEVNAEGYKSYSKAVSVGTADEQLDVSLVKEAEVGILPIAIVAVIVGCVAGLVVFIRKKFRK
jgi:hypothetical protein